MNYLLLFMVQVIVYLVLMLYDEYFGTLLAIILGAVAFVVWGLSYVVKWVQSSRVSPEYYRYVLTVWTSPLLSLLLFILLRGGIGWL